MTSDRQAEANRQNAKLSTGPQTEKGKAMSSRNALMHGLTARKGLLAGEDPEEHRRLREETVARLRPEGALELELVERIVSVLWRLRRVPVFEAALMDWLEQSRSEHTSAYKLPSKFPNASAMPRALRLGRIVEKLLSSDLSGKLSRYETSLQRQFSALLKELRDMQMRRLKEAESQERSA